MKFKTLMIIKAIVCLGFGLPMVILPEFVYGIFGISLTAGGAFAAREYGAAMLGNLFITWMARSSDQSKARRAIITGMLAYNAVALVASVVTFLLGDFNLIAWSIVLIYLFFTIGFGYFSLKPPQA